ncbi:hypothetical protein Q3C01_40255 [Bradyrhizobium sp. UFLA05-109]
MHRTFKLLAPTVIIGLSLTVGQAAEAPLPPRLTFVATPASQLHLGMTADDVIRVIGKSARETDFAIGTAQIRKFELVDAIRGQVILRDGKVTRVTLDVFRMEKDALSSSLRKAWPGLADSAVRRVLGEPTDVLHHTFFGIDVDQWVFARAGEADVSVFLRDGRVVARMVGRDVPQDLFRVDLPSQTRSESEGPLLSPRVGMMASEIAKLCGPVKFRVEYVVNGQGASRVVFESRGKETFVGVIFVDDIAIELENLGRLPDDPIFQGQ